MQFLLTHALDLFIKQDRLLRFRKRTLGAYVVAYYTPSGLYYTPCYTQLKVRDILLEASL